jgi:hypothetical protein
VAAREDDVAAAAAEDDGLHRSKLLRPSRSPQPSPVHPFPDRGAERFAAGDRGRDVDVERRVDVVDAAAEGDLVLEVRRAFGPRVDAPISGGSVRRGGSSGGASGRVSSRSGEASRSGVETEGHAEERHAARVGKKILPSSRNGVHRANERGRVVTGDVVLTRTRLTKSPARIFVVVVFGRRTW